MSEPAAAPPAKPKKSFVKLAGVGIVMIGVGAGGAYGLSTAGIIGAHTPEKVDHNPQLVRKGEIDPYAPPPAADAKDAGAEEEEEGSGGSEYRIAYYSFSDEFTSNLKESDGLVQLSLAASTRRDGRVLRRLARHELAIRSAVLVVLADTPEPGIDTVEGKARLQKRLTAAINDVLTRNEGFGGVDAVYFKSFLVQ
jgi:flagellar protein FliL